MYLFLLGDVRVKTYFTVQKCGVNFCEALQQPVISKLLTNICFEGLDGAGITYRRTRYIEKLYADLLGLCSGLCDEESVCPGSSFSCLLDCLCIYTNNGFRE